MLFRRLFSGETEFLAVVQYRPRQPKVSGGDGDRRFPVAASFDEAACPAAETVLLVSQTGQDGPTAHDQQAAQVGIPGLGDPAQACFAVAAVLAGHQPDPGGELASVLEVVAAAQTGDQRTGGGRAASAMARS